MNYIELTVKNGLYAWLRWKSKFTDKSKMRQSAMETDLANKSCCT